MVPKSNLQMCSFKKVVGDDLLVLNPVDVNFSEEENQQNKQTNNILLKKLLVVVLFVHLFLFTTEYLRNIGIWNMKFYFRSNPSLVGLQGGKFLFLQRFPEETLTTWQEFLKGETKSGSNLPTLPVCKNVLSTKTKT